jgi:hypothetical protein
VAIQADNGNTYILRVDPPTINANWQVLPIPVGVVTSINGQVGPTVTSWHGYGGVEAISYTINATQNVWSKITNATQTMFALTEGNGITLVNDTLVFAHAGDYIGTFALSFASLTGKDWVIRCYNITQAKQHGFRLAISTSGNPNYVVLTLPLYLEDIAVNDAIRFEIMCLTDNSDPIIKNVMFNLMFLHV